MLIRFWISYIIYTKYIYWPYAKGTVIDINNSTKEYLIKFSVNNKECKRILKNPSKKYEINSSTDIYCKRHKILKIMRKKYQMKSEKV